jgi:hypothetical protein
VRVTRDRRGYDHIYLIEETRKRGRPEGRLLYWCRLPGGLRVGRDPFDEDTRAALERANPGLAFDWGSLLKGLSASTAAARWSARRQRQESPAASPGSVQSDRARVAMRSATPRAWREDDDEIPDDAEGAMPGTRVAAEPDAAPGADEAGPTDEPPTF